MDKKYTRAILLLLMGFMVNEAQSSSRLPKALNISGQALRMLSKGQAPESVNPAKNLLPKNLQMTSPSKPDSLSKIQKELFEALDAHEKAIKKYREAHASYYRRTLGLYAILGLGQIPVLYYLLS